MEATIEKITEWSKWFDHLIASLRSDEIQLESGVASEALESHYSMLIRGNSDEMAMTGKMAAQRHFVTNIMVDYLKSTSQITRNKLAFSYNDSEVLVWVEIPEDREDLEKSLILAEAKINAKYHDFGFDMNTTVVEECDFLPVPNHYLSIIG